MENKTVKEQLAEMNKDQVANSLIGLQADYFNLSLQIKQIEQQREQILATILVVREDLMARENEAEVK